jgi:hypothetical protein
MCLKVAVQNRMKGRCDSFENGTDSEEYDEEGQQGAVDAEKGTIGHYLVCESDLSIYDT